MKKTCCSAESRAASWWVVWGFIFGLVWSAFGGNQEVAVFISGPARAVAGSRVQFELHLLNSSSEAAKVEVPSVLKGSLTTSNRTIDCQLELGEVSEGGTVTIPAGGFVKREYGLILPESIEGRVWLEVWEPKANPVILNVSSPAAETQVKKESEALGKEEMAGKAGEKAPKTGQPGFDAISFFKRHIFGYEPLYFIAGPDSPNAKFQVSFKYELLDTNSHLASSVPLLSDLYVAYTQTSLWDWNKPSSPFVDSSYKPELLFYRPRVFLKTNDWFRFDLQAGVQHESNGRDGAGSRSLNILYLKPIFFVGPENGLQLGLSPRAWVYVGGLEDNPDLAFYRGYADLRATLGWADGLQLASILRVGYEGTRGSLQLDLTYPLWKFVNGLSWYFQLQYFTGYGESLLYYDERVSIVRAGFSLYR
ncbi:MAG: phospholipase A [Candidatus Omnitrophica bacterium]|nr:phospholipase A [Candidatus Omnitrophota bacterium]